MSARRRGGLRGRKTLRFGPLRLHFTERGFTSWGITVGPVTWNARSGATSVDLPGPFRWQGPRIGGRKGQRR